MAVLLLHVPFCGIHFIVCMCVLFACLFLTIFPIQWKLSGLSWDHNTGITLEVYCYYFSWNIKTIHVCTFALLYAVTAHHIHQRPHQATLVYFLSNHHTYLKDQMRAVAFSDSQYFFFNFSAFTSYGPRSSWHYFLLSGEQHSAIFLSWVYWIFLVFNHLRKSESFGRMFLLDRGLWVDNQIIFYHYHCHLPMASMI